MVGYRERVEILTEDGEPVVSATVNYDRLVNPRSGIKSWRGVLTRIDPPYTLQAGGPYCLRLPNGSEGTILVNNVRISSNSPERATFLGSGPAPGDD